MLLSLYWYLLPLLNNGSSLSCFLDGHIYTTDIQVPDEGYREKDYGYRYHQS